RPPSTSGRVLESRASTREVFIACSQRGSPKTSAYHRREKLSGGKRSELALENDIGTTITTGRTRKTSTPMALAASAARLTQATVGLALKCFREALIWTPRGGSAAGTGRTARGSPPAARWKWPMRSPSSASG